MFNRLRRTKYDHSANFTVDVFIEKHPLQLRRRATRETETESYKTLVGNFIIPGKETQALGRQIRKLAFVTEPILVLGETGTGKEGVVRAIHEFGLRSEASFIKYNSASLTPDLADSELFGHVKGAFTGAISAKSGAFEQADKGTLFLNELAELAPSVQAKLLLVLEDGLVRPVGTSACRRVDVRVIAATNVPFAMLKEKLREDLIQRFVYTISVLPLQQRQEEIPVLAEYYMKQISNGRVRINYLAMNLLKKYPWPGNVRELINVLKNVYLNVEGGWILPQHLPPAFQSEKKRLHSVKA